MLQQITGAHFGAETFTGNLIQTPAKKYLDAEENYSRIFDQIFQPKEISSPKQPKKILDNVSIIETNSSSGEVIASLKIDFFANQLETYFDGKAKSVKLSVALGVIAKASVNFASIREEVNRTQDRSRKSPFSNVTVIKSGNKPSPIPIQVRGGTAILSSHNSTTSISAETIDMCEHLFDRRFAEPMCPLLGVSSTQNLGRLIHRIYIGRCILGLKKSVKNQWFSAQKHERERNRILELIKSPGSQLYSTPIL
ncbi:MAG: hypothetical protein CK425_01120 [Parachlamydia sp.]|nr:MAG: hypothetical protein CK425_01120 [Parachlamydia sp.]